jgi:selenocysteine lyase/cysteine desulfurase
MLSDSELRELRSRFPLASQRIYLNSCSKGLLCQEARNSMMEYLDTWDAYGAPWNLWLGKVEEARNNFADLVRALPEEVAVTFCVSTGTNAIASSLDFAERRKVIICDDEFPTLAHIWLAQQRRGAEIEFVTRQPDEDLADAFERAVDETTALVVAHQIHHATGAFLDAGRLARICHERGARLFLDAYHSAGVVDIDVNALNVDFLITGSMKYLLGATGGVAFLYVRRELIQDLRPLYTGWFSQRNLFAYDKSQLDYADSARRFESGLICPRYEVHLLC